MSWLRNDLKLLPWETPYEEVQTPPPLIVKAERLGGDGDVSDWVPTQRGQREPAELPGSAAAPLLF